MNTDIIIGSIDAATQEQAEDRAARYQSNAEVAALVDDGIAISISAEQEAEIAAMLDEGIALSRAEIGLPDAAGSDGKKQGGKSHAVKSSSVHIIP